MRILIDGRQLSKKHTGVSRYIENLILSYVDMYGKSNVFVIVNDKSYSEKYNILYTRYKLYNFIHFVLFYFFLIKQEFDLLHSPVYSSTFFKVKNKKYIITVHDLMYRIVPFFFSKVSVVNKLMIFYYDLIVIRSIKNSNLVLSVSLTTQSDLMSIFNADSILHPEGTNRIDVLKESDFVSKLHLEKNDYFLYVGNSRPHKNLNFLISSFIQSNTTKKLVLCGTNQNIITNDDNIITLGYVDETELSQLYANCSAFVFPSLYEGFGMPVLEALNLGSKVFCSKIGALSEFSDNCVAFFDPYDNQSLISLLETSDNIVFDKKDIELEIAKYDWTVLMQRYQHFLRGWILNN